MLYKAKKKKVFCPEIRTQPVQKTQTQGDHHEEFSNVNPGGT